MQAPTPWFQLSPWHSLGCGVELHRVVCVTGSVGGNLQNWVVGLSPSITVEWAQVGAVIQWGSSCPSHLLSAIHC